MGLTFGSCKIASPRRFHVERRNCSHGHRGLSVGVPWRQREALRVLRVIQRTALVMGLGLITLLTVFPNEVGSLVAEDFQTGGRSTKITPATSCGIAETFGADSNPEI
jgi:hypothetical protein